MTIGWKQYQDEAAAFFRSLGLDAQTDARIKGVRTMHDVDVLVISHHAGFDVTWIVECKLWTTAISKLHVLALREIVTDVGADRGILLAESGFQNGALEAANLTNVKLTSLAALSVTAEADILSMRLRELFDRLEACSKAYWSLAKSTRISHGLRPQVGTVGYSAANIIEHCKDVLMRALRGIYPFEIESLFACAHPDVPRSFASPRDAARHADALIVEMEAKLAAANSEPG